MQKDVYKSTTSENVFPSAGIKETWGSRVWRGVQRGHLEPGGIFPGF